jgi:hypothetical protein
MKRFLILLMVIGLMAGSVATAEGAKRPRRVERTVEGNYAAPPELVTGCNADRGSFACIVVDARPTEAFFTAKVTDAHGLPVFVQVVTEGGGRVGTFCGETTRPVSFDAGSSLEFLIEPTPYFFSHWGTEWLGPLDCPYRIQTSGSISVTLSNLP